jgi:hypothetical protein
MWNGHLFIFCTLSVSVIPFIFRIDNKLKNITCSGICNISGAKWHRHRKMLTPTFHFSILEQFVPVFSDKTRILLRKLREHVGKPEGVDITPLVTRCALDIICGMSIYNIFCYFLWCLQLKANPRLIYRIHNNNVKERNWILFNAFFILIAKIIFTPIALHGFIARVQFLNRGLAFYPFVVKFTIQCERTFTHF